MTPDQQWLVWSYEHDAWWRATRRGYSRALDEAGRYSYDEAARIVADANRYREAPNEIMVPAAAGATWVPALDDDALILQSAIELGTLPPGRIELVLQPESALRLAAVLQLALRHPGLGGEPRRIASTALAHIRTCFSRLPAVAEMLRRGDDPSWR